MLVCHLQRLLDVRVQMFQKVMREHSQVSVLRWEPWVLEIEIDFPCVVYTPWRKKEIKSQLLLDWKFLRSDSSSYLRPGMYWMTYVSATLTANKYGQRYQALGLITRGGKCLLGTTRLRHGRSICQLSNNYVPKSRPTNTSSKQFNNTRLCFFLSQLQHQIL